MRVGSLFTGIGGLDLGLERAGFEIAWQVEIDPFCLRLLGQIWPEVQKFGDIRECGAHNLAEVDLIVGGFPCQDISSAGKQAGIEGERSGLWKEQARIIDEIRPRYVIIENVAALLYAVRRPDGTKRPAAIQRVLRDLAALGYDATWRLCSAAEFGAPHLRKRVFIVAYLPRERSRAWGSSAARQPGQTDADSSGAANVGNSPGTGQQKRADTTGPHAELDASSQPLANADGDRRGQWANEPESRARRNGAANTGEDGEREHVADTSSAGLEIRNGRGPEPHKAWTATDECRRHQGQAKSPICRIFDGFPPKLDEISHRWPAGPGKEQHAWEPPRVITDKLTDRVARLKGLGNAALPQIAEAIGWGIKRHAEQERLEVDE